VADEEHKPTGERLQTAVDRLERAMNTRLAAIQSMREAPGQARGLFADDAGQSEGAAEIEALAARNTALEQRVATLEAALSSAIREIDRLLANASPGKTS